MSHNGCVSRCVLVLILSEKPVDVRTLLLRDSGLTSNTLHYLKVSHLKVIQEDDRHLSCVSFFMSGSVPSLFFINY